MNSKNIAKSLNAKLNDWCKNIDDANVVRAIKKDALITGGAIVSLLNGERPNDYDIYFRTKESCKIVAEYYINKWNASGKGNTVELRETEERVSCFIQSSNIARDDEESIIDDNTEPYTIENEDNPTQPNPSITKPPYRPRYFSTNAISLSDGIQLVIRFWGEVGDIHKNYDFVHCTCSYDWNDDKVNLPAMALEAIINKELYYVGSKYPLCSIIRTRKFISRGWSINAGQYVKMALQLNELDLTDMKVFEEQLAGVDSLYFNRAISYIRDRQESDSTFKVDNEYLFEIINKIF